MLLRIGLRLLLPALVASASVVAPTNLRSETVKPPDAAAPAPDEPAQRSADKGKGHLAPASAAAESRAVSNRHRRRLQGHDEARGLRFLPSRDSTRRHLAFLRNRRLKRARSTCVGWALRGPWSRTRTCGAGAMPTRFIGVGKI